MRDGWRRSSRCGSSACVEVATGDQVFVRDSKDLTIAPLRFTPTAWRAFVGGLKAGDF